MIAFQELVPHFASLGSPVVPPVGNNETISSSYGLEYWFLLGFFSKKLVLSKELSWAGLFKTERLKSAIFSLLR